LGTLRPINLPSTKISLENVENVMKHDATTNGVAIPKFWEGTNLLTLSKAQNDEVCQKFWGT